MSALCPVPSAVLGLLGACGISTYTGRGRARALRAVSFSARRFASRQLLEGVAGTALRLVHLVDEEYEGLRFRTKRVTCAFPTCWEPVIASRARFLVPPSLSFSGGGTLQRGVAVRNMLVRAPRAGWTWRQTCSTEGFCRRTLLQSRFTPMGNLRWQKQFMLLLQPPLPSPPSSSTKQPTASATTHHQQQQWPGRRVIAPHCKERPLLLTAGGRVMQGSEHPHTKHKIHTHLHKFLPSFPPLPLPFFTPPHTLPLTPSPSLPLPPLPPTHTHTHAPNKTSTRTHTPTKHT